MGIMQKFVGKVQAQTLLLGPGGITDSKSGLAAKSVVVRKLSLPVTAVANTDFTLSIPAGATLIRAVVYTTTGYGAATNANLTIGTSAGNNAYVTAVDVKAVGVYALTLVAAAAADFVSMPAPPNLFIRIAQVGTASATGAATLVVEYSVA